MRPSVLAVQLALCTTLAMAQPPSAAGPSVQDSAGPIRALEQDLDAEPHSARAAYLLARALDEAGHYQRAADAYARAASNATDPSQRALALYHQARMILALGRPREAAPLAAASLAARPTTEARDLDRYLRQTLQLQPATSIARALVLTQEATSPEPGLDLAIEFEFGADRMTSAGLAQADELASALARPEFAGARFLVVGHTDARGPESVNQPLSERRAAAVAAYLARHRIDATRLRSIGRGSRQPLSAGHTEADHQMNRRVEVRFDTH